MWIALAAFTLAPATLAQSPAPTDIQQLPAASGLSSYQGLTVRELRFPGLSDSDQDLMRKSPFQPYAIATCEASSIFVAAVWI